MSVLAHTTRPAELPLDRATLTLPAMDSDPLPLRPIAPSPCAQACPAGVNVKAYVSLIADERFEEALDVIRRRCPLPGVCGRVCHHPCEAACTRGQHDEPIAIRALKRFAADMEATLAAPPQPNPLRHEARMAVIGSGPAGLTTAYDLRRAGYPVTVFESQPAAGGMLRYGIARYRLPQDILDREIKFLLGAGIDLRLATRLGRDIEVEDLMRDGYRVVVLAVGAQLGRLPDFARAARQDRPEDALSFLSRVNGGERPALRGKVAVIGGGSTAIEAARTALRLGAAAVEIVYRRTRQEMPAAVEEIEMAEAEGITLRFLATPSGIVQSAGGLAGLECRRVALGDIDASGRRRPLEMPGSEFVIAAEHVLLAVGQEADLDFLPSQVKRQLAADGRLHCDPETGHTQLAGFFTAGDVASGPATVIEAIAAGHRVAEAIQRSLDHAEGDPATRLRHSAETHEYELPQAAPAAVPRQQPPRRGLREGAEFAEVELALSAQQAVAEARRCLRCGPCSECEVCTVSCARRHVLLDLDAHAQEHAGQSAVLRSSVQMMTALDGCQATGRLCPSPDSPWATETGASGALAVALRPARVRIHEPRCRGCGDCVEVCPFAALRLADRGDSPKAAVLDSAACRGCGLCVAVCPTAAALSIDTPPAWWTRRLHGLGMRTASAESAAPPCVVLACERRAGVIDVPAAGAADGIEVIRLRCTGRVNAGMILDILGHGAGRVVVAGCAEQRCRFAHGARFAREQLQLADELIRRLGGASARVGAEWSAAPQSDGLLHILRRYYGAVAESPGRPASGNERELGHGQSG